MKCHFELEKSKFCHKKGAPGRAFCPEHTWVTVPLYFTDDYADYKKFSSEYITSLPLKEWCVARGVALKENHELNKVVTKALTGKLCLTKTKSPKKLEVLLTAVRLMIAEAEDSEIELLLYRFFNTQYEPHFKTVRDFVTHEWFTDEERAYLKDFIQRNFIDHVTLKHQINALKRGNKERARLAKKNTK